ncbi:TolC family protein [Niabella drilacis]|uniref:Outer membrane protein n=1 Tax=Niabella drilacis (strain DSM 25811 / CCM 8410 / CCUG 62505 / LMG 26954 / E90) TaxID=1285928 RepID=A0A1G6XVE0_NIADE|nr:TolC family protein [Niabella drilacis]SDD81982.1 outer membrane protein [Niabella drilacis]
MVREKIAALFICFLSLPFQGNGQTDSLLASLPGIWTLEQCISYAKQHNIQVNALRLTEKTGEQNLLLSKAAKAPSLSGSTTQSFTNSSNADPVVGGFQTQSSFAGSYSLNSGITIYNGDYLNNDIRQKTLMVQAAQLNTAAMENSITLQITEVYLQILMARENIIYLKDLLQTSQAQLQQGQIKYNAGGIARKDLVGLQAQVATDNYNLTTAQNMVRQNTLALKQLLQLPSGYALQVIQPDTVATVPHLIDDLATAQQQAHDTRPEVKSSRLGVDIAHYDLLKARAGMRPTLTGTGALSTGYSDNQSAAYIKQLDNNFYQRIGLTLSIPIFNNRISRTNIENAKIETEQARLTLKNTALTLSQQVEQAYVSVLNAQAQYDAGVTQLNTNRETYQISGEQLRLGAITSVDYLLQKNLYLQALQQYLQAKYNAIISVKVYDFYKGAPLN